MNKTFVGQNILIHCYKHDGSIHRCWDKGLVLEETPYHFIVVNNRTLVTESEIDIRIQENQLFVISLSENGIMSFV